MNKLVSVFLAEGFEEVEAITPIDYLRRAGCEVTVTGVDSLTVLSSRKLSVNCDIRISDAEYSILPDLIVLPGGMPGSTNLAADALLENLTRRMFAAGKLVGAICAAPAVVLGEWGLLDNYKWTCFPDMEAGYGGTHLTQALVQDHNLITARAPGVAEEFSLALVSALCSPEESRKIGTSILARPPTRCSRLNYVTKGKS